MVGLTSLWLPILVAGVIVFVASSLVHMLLPWHKGDYPRLKDEDRLRDAVRPLAIPPGDYMVPRPATRDEMRSQAYADKVKAGPVMILTVLPNEITPMGRSLSQWFVYLLVVGVLVAYVTGRALHPGARYLEVFRFAGATAFVAYACALWQDSIWYRRAWRITLNYTLDGLIYALLTAGTFGWLWPR